jgi:hypothetical protein
MKIENWKTIKEILQEILQLAPTERSNFFNKSDVTVEIRREIESLLSQEKKAKDFMSVTAGGYARDFFTDNGYSENTFVSQQIGV